jgi:hypothetical protein
VVKQAIAEKLRDLAGGCNNDAIRKPVARDVVLDELG